MCALLTLQSPRLLGPFPAVGRPSCGLDDGLGTARRLLMTEASLVGFIPITSQIFRTAKKHGSLTRARSIARKVEYGTPERTATSI